MKLCSNNIVVKVVCVLFRESETLNAQLGSTLQQLEPLRKVSYNSLDSWSTLQQLEPLGKVSYNSLDSW
jgi:hypothetical protein